MQKNKAIQKTVVLKNDQLKKHFQEATERHNHAHQMVISEAIKNGIVVQLLAQAKPVSLNTHSRTFNHADL